MPRQCTSGEYTDLMGIFCAPWSEMHLYYASLSTEGEYRGCTSGEYICTENAYLVHIDVEYIGCTSGNHRGHTESTYLVRIVVAHLVSA